MWVWVIFFCFQLFQYYLKWSIKKEGQETLYIKDQDTGKPDTPQVEQIRYRTLFCGNERTARIFYVRVPSHSVVSDSFATPRTVACPLSMGLFRQKYWRGLPFLGDLLPPGIEPTSPASPALAGGPLPPPHLGRPYLFKQSLSDGRSSSRSGLTHPFVQLLQQCDMSQCGGEGLNCHGPQPGHKPPATGEGEPLCPTSWGPPQPPESVTTLLGSRDALLHNHPAGKMPWITTPLCNSEFRRPEPCWVHLLPSAPCWILFFSVHLWSRAKLGVLIIWIIMVLNFLSFFKKQHSEECLKLYGSFI